MKSLAVVLALFAASVFVANAAMTEAQHKQLVNEWSIVADKHKKCTAKLTNLTADNSLETFLNGKQCEYPFVQCNRAFTNSFVDSSLFQLEAVLAEYDTFVLEVICFKSPGVTSFGGNASFIAFVADTKVGQVTQNLESTFRFYKDFDAVNEPLPYFGDYYILHTGAAQMLLWLPLMALPVVIQRMLF